MVHKIDHRKNKNESTKEKPDGELDRNKSTRGAKRLIQLAVFLGVSRRVITEYLHRLGGDSKQFKNQEDHKDKSD